MRFFVVVVVGDAPLIFKAIKTGNYLPHVRRISIRFDVITFDVFAFIRTNPRAHRNMLLCADSTARPRNTWHTQLHLIWKRGYGVTELNRLFLSRYNKFFRGVVNRALGLFWSARFTFWKKKSNVWNKLIKKKTRNVVLNPVMCL